MLENQVWVEVKPEDRCTGLGETFFNPATVEAYVHEVIAPYLIGKNALQIDRHARNLNGYLGFSTTGAERRGNSAVDIALWDIFGQSCGQPIWQLLGGLSRERIRIYNTCAGPLYGNRRMAHFAETDLGGKTRVPDDL